MEMIFHSHKTHFYKKGCAPGLILKMRVFGTRKWPIPLQGTKLLRWLATVFRAGLEVHDTVRH